eukprot:3285457-Pleurochrysis_carterae.AAC.1
MERQLERQVGALGRILNSSLALAAEEQLGPGRDVPRVKIAFLDAYLRGSWIGRSVGRQVGNRRRLLAMRAHESMFCGAGRGVRRLPHRAEGGGHAAPAERAQRLQVDHVAAYR